MTWLNTKTSEQVTSFYISSQARFLANLSLNYQWNRLMVNATAIYKKRDPQSATAIDVKVNGQCFMANVKAGYGVIKNRLYGFIEVDDLSNSHCRDLVRSLRPSRWVMGGVSMTIGK